MAETTTPRIMAAALEFNIGKDTLMDFLKSKGFETNDLKPTSKISEDMYTALQKEFQPDKLAKKKAEAVDLPKSAPVEVKKRKDEQDISIVKKEKEVVVAKDEVKDEPPAEETSVIAKEVGVRERKQKHPVAK